MKADRIIKLNELVKKINGYKEEMRGLSDADLQDKTRQFKERLNGGEDLEKLLPEAFAAIREADFRILKEFPYDNQVLAAIVIHQGNIADMKTGEGKSITATMPLYLNALSGKGAMLVTVNAYLANRDGQEFGEVYKFMGLSVAIGAPPLSSKDFSASEKREIYSSDIIYTTSGTLGFDYLTENLAINEEEKYLRPYHYVVIDEADAVLLDSAQMPLVISGVPRVQSNLFSFTNRFTATLRKEDEYEFDPSGGSVCLTQEGIEVAQRFYHLDNLYDEPYFQLNRHINLALRAKELFLPLRDYLIIDGEVGLLNSTTGRLMLGNKLQGGLHQAIEAKESVEITRENRAMASITFQNLFVMFDKMSGMTGTAKGSEEELLTTYQTKVIEIPTYKPVIRTDEPAIIVDTIAEKEKLIVEYVKKIHETGRPILITTSSVKNSDTFSNYLLKEGISHNLLNALSEAKEAEIIKEAGQMGAVTVATLMAGRGTDIKIPDEVKKIGGLAIVGTEIMPSQRIEWQVRGRAGRMGDPGSSRFYGSMEDDLFVKFGSIKQENLPKKRISKSKKKTLFIRAQRASEDSASGGRNLSQKFDLAMAKQREIVYGERDRIIDGEKITSKQLGEIASSVFEELLTTKVANRKDLLTRFVFDTLSFHLPEGYDALDFQNDGKIKEFLMKYFVEAMEKKKFRLEYKENYDKFQNLVILKAIDEAWVEQVDFLEQLKTVVSDRHVAQHKLEYEYRREAYYAFEEMKKRVNKEVVRLLCLSEIETKEDGSMVVQFA